MRRHAIALIVFCLALPLTAANNLQTNNGQNGEVHVTGNGQLRSFHYTPNNASLTIGTTTFPIVFEKDGSVTFNGVNARTNEQLLGVIVQSGIAVSAVELDEFIAMLQSGEIKIDPKKRAEALMQLLTLWRSRIQ